MTITEKWQGPAVCPAGVVCLATKTNLKGEKSHNEFLLQESITLFWYRNISGYRKDESKRIERYLDADTNKEKTGINTSVLDYVHFREEM